MGRRTPGPPPILGVGHALLLGSALAVGAVGLVLNQTVGLLGFLGVAVGCGLGLWLATGPAPLARYAGGPVAAALLLDVLGLPVSFASLVLGVAAGSTALAWVGAPRALRLGVPRSDLARELLLPVAGGATALVAAALPLLDLFRPAALVIPAFAGLALLVVLLAEVSLARGPSEPSSSG